MMTVRGAIVVSTVFFCIGFAAIPAAGQWVENGTAVSTATGGQAYHDIIEVQPGLIVVAWEDSRGSNSDIYAQMIDPYGNTLWTLDGVPVCTETGNQGPLVIVPDGAGGVVIAWEDWRNGDKDIYAQRLDISGNTLWASGGVSICSLADIQEYVRAVSDGVGGAIIAWQDARFGSSDMDIYAQRIDASGTVQWTGNGISVCGESDFQGAPSLTGDDSGGALIAWVDQRGSSQDIYAQRVGSNGVLQWTTGGVVVSEAVFDQQAVMLLSDGYGGAILTWQDDRNGSTYDIYAQRTDADGNMLWLADGVALCSAVGNQFIHDIVTDGADGAIVAWTDFRTGLGDAYAQRVNRNGLPLWAADGVGVCIDSGNQWITGIVSDGAGGVIISLQDSRSGDDDIYVQRIEGTSGMSYWTTEGIPLCDIAADQADALLVSDGAGGAVAVWRDRRNEFDGDLYAQRIVRDGFWGYPCPWVIEAEDVPNDQGGQAMLTFAASRLDDYTEGNIQYYSVWRKLGILEMQAMLDAGTKETLPSMVGPEFDGEAYRFISLEGAMSAFEWLANVDAHEMPEYSYTAATLYDSTAVDPGIHTFMVSAHAYLTSFWDSPPVEAYSVDNLSPCVPLALAGEQSFTPAGMELTWDPNIEDDLGGYNIYRDIGESFEPGTGNLIATTCDENLFDGDWGWDVGFCYKVSAIDIHGNESDHAVLCAGQITGDDPMPLPDKTFLGQNFPNPFNPNTTIAFGLKSGGFVNLSIYNAAGQLVSVLINESRPAGPYTAVWNGKDQDGSSVTSGVYFYKLTAKEFEETKKMILLR